MAKKTRTELSTLAINTNLPDNTQELITPTTERSQLTDERESVVNYKDDLGGTSNAGKFLTVAVDGESLTMVDAPTGDVTGTGVAGQVTIWDDTNNITSKAMLVLDDTFKVLKIIIPSENASGGISIDKQGTTGSGSLVFLDDGVYKAQIVYDVSDGNLTLNSNGDIEITADGDTVISGGTPIVENVRISSGGNATFNSQTIDVKGVSAGNTSLRLTANGQTAGTDSLDIIVDGSSSYLYNRANTSLVLGTNSTPRLTITSGGKITFDNNLRYIEPVATGDTMRISQNSFAPGGLQFGLDNGTSFSPKISIGSNWVSTLDAYEEGTWTPTFNANITTSGTPSGKYTRVGRLIHATCVFGYSALTGSDIAISGLPYNNGSVRESTVNAFSGVGRTTNQFFGVVVEASASTFYVEVLNSASGVSFTATASCWYQV